MYAKPYANVINDVSRNPPIKGGGGGYEPNKFFGRPIDGRVPLIKVTS